MADSIIVKYEADISSLKAQLTELKNQNLALNKSVDEFGKKSETAGNKAATSLKGVNQQTTVAGNLFNNLGTQIAAAFSVGAIIAWSATALNAYKEQEKALVQLKASLETVANEGTQAFNKLVTQAEKLQKVSIFSDEQIEQTQTMLVNFGLTSRQTEILTNRIVDFASRTGKSLEEATGIFIRGIQGQTRGLIEAGAKFDDTGSKIGNFNALLQATEKFAGGAATALGTQAGQLQNIANQIDDINEQTGESLASTELFFAKSKLIFARFAEAFTSRRLFGVGGFSLKELFFGKDEPAKLPEELNNVAKAVEAIAARRDAAFAGSLNKSLIGLSDAELKAEIKRLESLEQANTIAVKDRVDLINKELEIRKKAREKAAEEEKKQFEEQRKIWETARDEYEKIEKEKLDFQRKVFEVAREEYENAEKDKADFARKQFEVAREEYEQLLADQVKAQEEAERRKRENIQATFSLAIDLTNQISDLLSAQDQAQIDAINQRKDAAIEGIDNQLSALEQANDKGKISDKKYEEEKQRLLNARKAQEKKAAEETKKIKQQEAEREKLYTIFSITLSTARAIIAALAAVPPNPILAAIAGVTGAAQLAIALATPIPQFAKGTKGKEKSGVGIVGEKGAEFVYMPQGTQVVPADRTKRYKDAVNAMIDGQFEQYVYKAMIAPALREATKKMEEKRTKSFAENIANVFNNNPEGFNEYRMRDALGANNKRQAEAIAKALSKYVSKDSNDRYYH